MRYVHLVVPLLLFSLLETAEGVGRARRIVERLDRDPPDRRQPAPIESTTAMRTHRDISYVPADQPGSTDRQVLDIHAPLNASSHPVWVYIHGGAWASGDKQRAERSGMAAAMVRRGYVVVAVNYRFTPPHSFPANVQDVASAIAWVHRHIPRYGGDSERIFLMGHSAGAHLASMVGADATYLRAYGLRPNQLRGVVALDTQAYNLELIASNNGSRLPPAFARAFGQDPNVWGKASPALGVSVDSPPPPFAICYSGGRRGRAPEDRREQAHLFAEALRQRGGRATVVSAPTTTHSDIMDNFGKPTDRVTTEALRAIGAPE